MADAEIAVLFRNASKSYGRGSNAKVVLDDFSMSVPRGSIYGLLGASGCGKTTILSCIAGRLKLDSGDLQVLGGTPGTKGSGIPGPRIGYMPQEVSLADEMTAKNVLYYFGWMFGMTAKDIAERYEFLSKLLELPPSDRFVRDLSGGQQRRVSLAASLVQTPELLLLDEPTVGLDPLLRQSIWDYLMEISRDRNMTIIITTHYIEEAMQAHKIGFLREGALLADAPPESVIAQYNCSSLEEVYLLLSQHQENKNRAPPAIEVVTEGVAVEPLAIQSDIKVTADVTLSTNTSNGSNGNKAKSRKERPIATSRHRLRALLYKDFLSLFRNHMGIVFMFLLPFLQIPIFFLAIGNDPFDLSLGIVNDEYSNCHELMDEARNTSAITLTWDGQTKGCHYERLSCLFIEKLDDQAAGIVNLIFYRNREAGLKAARSKRNHALLHIPSNFSEMLQKRQENIAIVWSVERTTDEELEKSEIKAWIDKSNYLIGNLMHKYILEKFGELTDAIADGCEINRKTARLPVQFLDPVYGKQGQAYRESMVPGVILLSAYFLSAVLTATTLTTERTNGLWDRNLVAGATHAEVILSHILCNITGMMITATEILGLAFIGFGTTCHGSLVAVVVLVLLQAFAGITYGILISAVAKSFVTAVFIAIGTVLPHVLISGSVWPLEGMPRPLQIAAFLTPATLPSTAMSNIIIRGLSAFDQSVYPGFLVTLVWIVLPYLLSVFILRRN